MAKFLNIIFNPAHLKMFFLMFFISSISIGQADLSIDEGRKPFTDYVSEKGKFIRNITISTRDISSESLQDEEAYMPKWFGSFVNSLHIETQEWVVDDYLLFEEGDRLEPELLKESERLLRASGLFLDARIRIAESFPDSADVVVITKDKWTLSLNLSYQAKNKSGYFGISDDNILGYGHAINAKASYERQRNIGWGGEFIYKAQNIAGTYVNAEGLIVSNGRFLNRSLSASRPFYRNDTKYAGGISLSWLNGNVEFIDDNEEMITLSYKQREQDLWFGRSYPLFFGPDIFRSSSRLITSARVSRTRFPSRPEVTETSNRLYENQTLYLFNFGFINRRYFKDHYIDNFGKTEDIEVGGILSLTLGSDVREFNDRLYAGMLAVYSKSIPLVGYFSAKGELGGFRNVNNWEQNVFNFNFTYHSPLDMYSKFKLRHFLQFDYLLGFDRFTGEQIFLNTLSGLRGIDGYELNGTKRMTLNLETRIFTGLTPLGFVLGGILFSDLGMISGHETSLTNSKVYQSYGIGLRTSNESFAGASFEISLVYNPFDFQNSSGAFNILFSGSFIIGSRNFGFSKPSIIPFGYNRI